MQRIRCTDAAEGSYRLEFSDHRSADGEAGQTLKKKQSNGAIRRPASATGGDGWDGIQTP